MGQRLGHVVESYYGFVSLHDTTWSVTWSFLPHRCLFTGKWIAPFTAICRGKQAGTGGMTEGTLWTYYWTTPIEFLTQRLKDNV